MRKYSCFNLNRIKKPFNNKLLRFNGRPALFLAIVVRAIMTDANVNRVLPPCAVLRHDPL